jgi:hypothetical protein
VLVELGVAFMASPWVVGRVVAMVWRLARSRRR